MRPTNSSVNRFRPTLESLEARDVPSVVSVMRIADPSETGTVGLLRFTRDGDVSQPVAVNYTVSGTATMGIDYQPISPVINFSAGATFVDVPIIPIPDADPESTESVAFAVAPGFGYLPKSLLFTTARLFDNNAPVATPGYVVTTAADNEADDGKTSLREAIKAANAAGGGMKVITFDTTQVTGPIILGSQLPKITHSVYIAWTRSGRLTIQRDTQQPDFRLFEVDKDV